MALAPLTAINFGTPQDRCWFGYVYRGGPATVDDFEVGSTLAEVLDARAYRYVSPSELHPGCSSPVSVYDGDEQESEADKDLSI
jgi:hypothetical protein